MSFIQMNIKTIDEINIKVIDGMNIKIIEGIDYDVSTIEGKSAYGKAYAKAYRKGYRAKHLQKIREWREKHKAKLNELQRQKYYENKNKPQPNYIPFKITRTHIVLYFE
jgi:hypothetical protein